MDVSYERRVEEGLRFDPEIVPRLSLAFRVGDQRGDELQDVLLGMDIGERVIMHRLPEIDRVEDLDAVLITQERLSAFKHDRTFRICYDVGTVALEKV